MGALWAMGHSTGPAKKAAAPTTRVDKDICHFLRIAPPDDTFCVPCCRVDRNRRSRLSLSGHLDVYCERPICFMNVRLSQKRYSSSITPFFQCPTVTISSLNGLLVGGMVLPAPTGIGRVKVPSKTDTTAVQSACPILIG